MITIETRDTPDLHLRNDVIGQSDDSHVRMVGREFEATRRPNFHDNPKLFEALCGAASPLTQRLIANDYKLWLFLVGAPFAKIQERRLGDYDLSRPARKAGLVGNVSLLKDLGTVVGREMSASTKLIPMTSAKRCSLLPQMHGHCLYFQVVVIF